MDWDFFVSSVVGFVPSFGILYFAWGKLEGLFNEKKLFFNYFIGWVIGIIISVFFLILIISVGDYIDLSIFSVILFAIFTEMFKYIYLNTPKNRGKYQLPYYGFALGLGIGAIWCVSLMYYYLRNVNMSPVDYSLIIIYFIVFSTGLSSIHASTGAFLGYGIYKKEPEKYILLSLGYMAIFNLTLLPFIWAMYPLYYISGIIISIPLLYYKIYKGVLIYTIPKEVMKKWKKERKE